MRLTCLGHSFLDSGRHLTHSILHKGWFTVRKSSPELCLIGIVMLTGANPIVSLGGALEGAGDESVIFQGSRDRSWQRKLPARKVTSLRPLGNPQLANGAAPLSPWPGPWEQLPVPGVRVLGRFPCSHSLQPCSAGGFRSPACSPAAQGGSGCIDATHEEVSGLGAPGLHTGKLREHVRTPNRGLGAPFQPEWLFPRAWHPLAHPTLPLPRNLARGDPRR